MKKTLKQIREEAPVNCAGAGAIAGLGIGPAGIPGVKKNNRKKVIRRNIGGVEVFDVKSK